MTNGRTTSSQFFCKETVCSPQSMIPFNLRIVRLPMIMSYCRLSTSKKANSSVIVSNKTGTRFMSPRIGDLSPVALVVLLPNISQQGPILSEKLCAIQLGIALKSIKQYTSESNKLTFASSRHFTLDEG